MLCLLFVLLFFLISFFLCVWFLLKFKPTISLNPDRLMEGKLEPDQWVNTTQSNEFYFPYDWLPSLKQQEILKNKWNLSANMGKISLQYFVYQTIKLNSTHNCSCFSVLRKKVMQTFSQQNWPFPVVKVWWFCFSSLRFNLQIIFCLIKWCLLFCLEV